VNSSACGSKSRIAHTTCSYPPGIVSHSCTTATLGNRAASAALMCRLVIAMAAYALGLD